MKLDRDGSYYRAHAAIIGEEIHSSCRTDELCSIQQQLSAHRLGEAVADQAKFGQVKNVGIKDMFRRFALQFFVLIASNGERVAFRQPGQNFSLQFPIKSHMPDLRDRRFDWNQNDITAWPGTHLRPG